MKAQPCITGLGFICSIGNDRETVTESLIDGRSGLGPFPHTWSDESTIQVAGTLDGFDLSSPDRSRWSFPSGFEIPPTLLRGCAPHTVYAYGAMTQAMDDAGIEVGSEQLADAGLYCASAGSPMLLHHHLEYMRSTHGRRANPVGVLSSIAGTLNFSLGSHFGIRGGNCGFVSACTSSAHAMGYAVEDLLRGRIDTAVIVAGEDLTPDSLLPFAGMRALSTSGGPRASRPFDRDRDGFVPTGGGVAIILEMRESPCGYARIRHWDHNSDGYDAAISHPDGDGIFRAMSRLLKIADLTPADIDYLNAHATSTQTGDRSEAIGIRRFLGKTPVAVSSTKGITGHGLSMTGALEAAFCALMLKAQFHAGNPHLENPDSCCDGLYLPRQSEKKSLHRIISNSCGFGGSNVCLLLEAV